MDESSIRQGPGRPRDLEKRAAILDAALELFSAHGVEAVAIETVAARAKVSKVTIYNQFGDKTNLFVEVVRREFKRIAAAFERLNAKGASLEDKLNTLGVSVLWFLMQKRAFEVDRLIAAEAERHPDLALAYFNEGPGQVRKYITAILDEAARAGDIEVDNAQLCAEDIATLWQGFLPLEMRLGLRKIEFNEIEYRVRRGTERFLKAARYKNRRNDINSDNRVGAGSHRY